MDVLEKAFPIATDLLNVSERILVNEFVHQWVTILSHEEMTNNDPRVIPYQLITDGQGPIPQDILQELFVVCDPLSSLYPTNTQNGVYPTLKEVPSNITLKTVRRTKKEKKEGRAGQLRFAKKYSQREDVYLAHKFAQTQVERQPKKPDGRKPIVQHPEALLTVSVLKHCDSHKNRERPLVVLHALGSTKLSQLRDSIRCHKEQEIPGDFSSKPDNVKQAFCAKEIFPSSMIFIEDKFYVDNRSSRCVDYSREIINWLKGQGSTTAHEVLSMDTCLRDLEVRLGFPYVYIHQGSCEHVLQFIDLRLVNSDDCQFVDAYPIRVSAGAFAKRPILCNACQLRHVQWMVRNSDISPSDPCHYCDVCFQMLHYDKQGNKLCDFQVFHYTDQAYVVD